MPKRLLLIACGEWAFRYVHIEEIAQWLPALADSILQQSISRDQLSHALIMLLERAFSMKCEIALGEEAPHLVKHS